MKDSFEMSEVSLLNLSRKEEETRLSLLFPSNNTVALSSLKNNGTKNVILIGIHSWIDLFQCPPFVPSSHSSHFLLARHDHVCVQLTEC